jgi:RNA polymerase sigma-70 factor (sigma-E family)
VERAERGDEAFNAFVASRGWALVRFAYVLTGGRGAEDLVQDALAGCYLHWARIQPAGAEAYVRRSIVNGGISRRRRRSVMVRPLVDDDAPVVDDRSAEVDLRQSLWQALDGLSPRQRAVLVLTYYEDLPDTEVAALLGCSPNTVKGHRAAALRTLRRTLPDFDDEKERDDARSRA